mmetsp:Transcript_15774/g.47504  ORF Transcript_15774/g.47504 Transcript_15774/m.47504 type:complete len:222 (+) Transcript_15774:516-1181(+)
MREAAHAADDVSQCILQLNELLELVLGQLRHNPNDARDGGEQLRGDLHLLAVRHLHHQAAALDAVHKLAQVIPSHRRKVIALLVSGGVAIAGDSEEIVAVLRGQEGFLVQHRHGGDPVGVVVAGARDQGPLLCFVRQQLQTAHYVPDKDAFAEVLHEEGSDEAAIAALHNQLRGTLPRRPLEDLHPATDAGQHLALEDVNAPGGAADLLCHHQHQLLLPHL